MTNINYQKTFKIMKKQVKATKPQVEITKTTIKKQDGTVYKSYEYKCNKPIMFRFGVQVLYKEYDNE